MKTNLFIVGTVKGGTTWLYDVLATNPEVFANELKEPHFFTPRKSHRKHMRAISSIEEYNARNLKASPNHKYRVDGSATYVSSQDIPKLIYSYNSNSKIIIMLRHPVERAYSQYQMDLREGLLDASSDFKTVIRNDNKLDDLIDGRLYVKLGLYHEIVNEYINRFGNENVLILSFHDLVRDKQSVINSVVEFLEIENVFSSDSIDTKKNVAALPRNLLFRQFLASDTLRYYSRFIPKKMRSYVKDNVLVKKVSNKLDLADKEDIYNEFFKDDSEKLFEFINKRLW